LGFLLELSELQVGFGEFDGLWRLARRSAGEATNEAMAVDIFGSAMISSQRRAALFPAAFFTTVVSARQRDGCQALVAALF
jgi:hypothetical protein